ncbi:unnamed protein product [Nezara viridula]|uniref:Chitin-binding type-2 domain-containing protein n=1 Tax=Nezara viridula TaxID=85310 RepID=A0A9P0H735_NEZVI|nr:unnamed protein product [Nezara viridula]
MRVLTAVLFLAAFVAINAEIRLPDPSWAVEVKPDPTKRRLLELNNPLALVGDDIVCNKIFSCADCSTSRVCHPKDDGTLVHLTDITCPEDRPYCDSASGTCLSTASLDCGAEDNFVCLEKNAFFPDPDCKKFHYCNEKFQSKLFKCIGDGTVYNAAQKRCVTQTDSSSCGKFNCDGNTLKKMKHSNFPRYYAMCKTEENIDQPLVVGVCPPYYEIGVNSQVCEPDCQAHGNGNVPDATDCHKYFTCSETKLADGRVYMQRTSKSCPTGNSFDTSLFMCVPDPNKQICNK